ncbi:hypothetical protein [Ferviditalea candida]|uniref:Uncharacterized protein n=1 Tax=Ferviditalea candida TaxID=3108399 RepID=A0ABU5ZDF4_9BACL|nr:hypothetical protein [Paenibacillaceae bacterium T2]
MAVYYSKPVLTQEIVVKMVEAAAMKTAELGIQVNKAKRFLSFFYPFCCTEVLK